MTAFTYRTAPPPRIRATFVAHRLLATTIVLCFGSMAAGPLRADLDRIPEQSGFSGFVGLGAAVNNVKSNMTAGTTIRNVSKRTTDSISSSPESRTTGQPTFNIDLRYTFASTRTQLMVGQEILNVVRFDFASGIGVAQEMPDDSVVTVKYLFPSVPTKVWEDPYVEGEPRNRTDRKSNGARISWSGMLGSNFTTQYTYRKIDINKERSGVFLNLTPSEQKLLSRDGDTYEGLVRYTFDLGGGHVLEPELVYAFQDRDGRARKNNRYAGQINYFYKGSQYSIVANAYLGKADYDEENPIYDKTQDDTMYGLGSTFFYHRPFGFKGWAAVLGLNWYKTDSNIDFYNEDLIGGSLSALYRF